MPRHRSFVCLWVFVATALPAATALAGWSPDGVTVRPTTARIQAIAACSDGASGTFVAWQELSADPVSHLRVQHLLSTGDLDPAWPVDGAPVSDVDAERALVDVLPDHLGGVYVCWTGGSSVFVTRLDPSGQIAAGWPASGKLLGTVSLPRGRPRAIEDGSHGLFVVWTTGVTVAARRLGPDGLGTGGWPNGNRVVVPVDPSFLTAHYWPDLALAPDGVFASWATWSMDTTQVESGMYLWRLTGAGTGSPAWPGGRMYVGPFRPEETGATQAQMLDISPDGRGGLFWIAGTLPPTDVRVGRILGDGATSPGWPTGGRVVPGYFSPWDEVGPGPDYGVRVQPDGLDGGMVETPSSYLHSPSITSLRRFSDTGNWSDLMECVSAGHEVVAKGDGGVFMASFKPTGASQPYDWDAFLSLRQSYAPPGWTQWGEVHYEQSVSWYGDIGLALAGDGGAVFFWSQHRERFGLFARRFTNAGQVTGVEPEPATGPPGLHGLRFVAGTGVVARVRIGGLGAQLDLFDVGGRRVSSRTIDGPDSGVANVTLPETGSLAPGIYFARLAWEGSAALGKVAVVR